MTATELKPTGRLLRAAEAERSELAAQRDVLVAARDEAIERLRELEELILRLDERRRLLDELAPAPEGAQGSVEGPVHQGGSEALLRGPAIRETAVRLILSQPGTEALHYRAWFELLVANGYEVAGKDPLAVFLTQISRSPVIRKGTQAGVYELDRAAPRRLAERLTRLQRELGELTARTPETADLSEIRARRTELTTEITHVEKALEEARALLGPAASPPAGLAASA